jgi:CRISPR/Cas system-associated protein endoribonuclease Cas2
MQLDVPWEPRETPRQSWLSTGYIQLQHAVRKRSVTQGSSAQTHESKSKNFCSIDERDKENPLPDST